MISFDLTSPWQWAYIIEFLLGLGFAAACLILAVVALLKCMPKAGQMFEMRFKRTKGFWLGMTGGACALGLFGFFGQLGGGPFGLLFPVAAACMASVYLVDVDPEVSQ